MLIGRDIARHLDPVLFAQDAGITPDPWQADLLRAMPRRALLLCSRQSGKTTVTALMALHRAIYEPKALVIIVSPSQPQSDELLRTIKIMRDNLTGAPDLVAESVRTIEFTNGSRIKAMPGAEGSVRGFAGVSLVVIDESSRVPDEMLAAVSPMLATRRDGSLIALTTPKGKRGWFYELWASNDPLWHRTRIPASACPRITPEYLSEELKRLGAMGFAEEYNLVFADTAESAFPTTIIDCAFTKEVSPLWS